MEDIRALTGAHHTALIQMLQSRFVVQRDASRRRSCMLVATMHELPELAAAVRAALADANQGLVEREALVEVIGLAAVAGEHLLVIGPPGTAKSEAVRRVARVTGASTFEYLLGRFTEPSEIFGPVDLAKLREGTVVTSTEGMLPEAEIAFLDEVFQGSTAILNALLTLLNERTFRRGHTRMACPLRTCVGASNALPADESLAAFADRFLLHIFLTPIPDPRLEELLEEGWALQGHAPARETTLESIDRLGKAALEADLSAVRVDLAHAVRVLRASGVMLSDRRVVRAQRLLAAAAVLDGRKNPSGADLWTLVYAVPTAEGQQIARDALRDLLDRSQNATLPASSAEASCGPLARAQRIAKSGREALAARPDGDLKQMAAWRLRLESVAREIDAGFAAEAMPPELAAIRSQIVEALNAGEAK
jgi:MoxR-like ATPase